MSSTRCIYTKFYNVFLALVVFFNLPVLSQENSEVNLTIEEIKLGIQTAQRRKPIEKKIEDEQKKIKEELTASDQFIVRHDYFYNKITPFSNQRNLDEDSRAVLAAACYEAAIQKCTAPLEILKEKIDFCIYGVERYYLRDLYQKYSIQDFPAMFLAYECGNDSVPILTEMLHSDSIDYSKKIKAFFIMLQIDPVEAKSQFAIFSEKYPDHIEPFKRVLALGDVESIKAWEISMVVSDRMQETIKARKARQKSRQGN